MTAPARAQEAHFRFLPLDTAVTRVLATTLTIDMVMHEETETGEVADESYTSTRSERRSARMLDSDAARFQFTFEEFTSDDATADPEEMMAIETLLRKPYRIELTDSSGIVSLHGDSVSSLERYFVENEYMQFMMEYAFSRILGEQTLAVGDSLVLPVEIAASIFQGMHLMDLEEEVTIRLASVQRMESGTEQAVFSFSARTEKSDESAYIEMASAGTVAVELQTARPLNVTSAGTIEIVATENPSVNRGSGTMTGKKLFTYPDMYKP